MVMFRTEDGKIFEVDGAILRHEEGEEECIHTWAGAVVGSPARFILVPGMRSFRTARVIEVW